jgi:biopolymer transport protein ExbD
MARGILGDVPQSKRRYRFALTPLADAMFQLLIFFMLSSSLTPYSLLTLSPGAGTQAASGETPSDAPPGAAGAEAASWVIDSGSILAGGQRFSFDALPQLAGALSAVQTRNVLLISSPQAQVQDLVTVLEALSAAGITAVQIVAGVVP